MIDREQAMAAFQDAVDHADWSGRESVLAAGIDAVLALDVPTDRERLRARMLEAVPRGAKWAAWVDGVLARVFDR